VGTGQPIVGRRCTALGNVTSSLLPFSVSVGIDLCKGARADRLSLAPAGAGDAAECVRRS
jgi:hypothetical protein